MCGVLPRRRADGICSQHGGSSFGKRQRSIRDIAVAMKVPRSTVARVAAAR